MKVIFNDGIDDAAYDYEEPGELGQVILGNHCLVEALLEFFVAELEWKELQSLAVLNLVQEELPVRLGFDRCGIILIVLHFLLKNIEFNLHKLILILITYNSSK